MLAASGSLLLGKYALVSGRSMRREFLSKLLHGEFPSLVIVTWIAGLIFENIGWKVCQVWLSVAFIQCGCRVKLPSFPIRKEVGLVSIVGSGQVL